MADLPPLPPGFTLDQPDSNLPPLPPGFTLDAQPKRFGTGRSFDSTDQGLVPSNSQAARNAIAPDGGPLRQVALHARAAAEGVVGTLASPIDLNPAGMIRNAISQKLGLPDMTITGLMNRGLNAAGAYSPETPGEQMGTAVTRGVAGALTGGGLANGAQLAASQLPNMIRTALSGATGAGASELARQKGYGSGVQILAGLAGGLAPAAIEEGARLAGRTAMNVVAPMTKSGQEAIAGRVMANQATDTQAAAANLQKAQEIVPGSARNTGEASQDVGLLALEKGLRSRNPAAFGQRISEQNAARQDALASVAGTPEDIQVMQVARNAETSPMREMALDAGKGVVPASTQSIVDSIDSVLASPIGKRDIPSAALNWVKGKIQGESDPANLYAVRQDIGDALAGKLGGDQAKFRLARKELMDVRSQLDDAIEQAAPGFKAYLQRYSEFSQPIDQLKVMQEIQRRAQLTSADVTTGQNFMGSANFSRALDSALAKNGNRLTEAQIEKLNAIKTDLQYGQAINSPLIKAPGSDTFQNLSIAQAIGAGGKALPGPLRVILKPLEWLYKAGGSDQGINDALTRAMLDPKLASQMLLRATPQRMAQFSERLKAAGIGATAGTLATQSAPSAVRNMPAEAR